ncbi:MAG: ATP-binding protein [Promethearchaeia archaeon]
MLAKGNTSLAFLLSSHDHNISEIYIKIETIDIQTAIADTTVDDVDLIVEDTSTPENPAVLANELLTDVFVNLFTNAIKYTEQTPKTIELEWEPWESNPLFLHIRISDHGVGIADKKKAQATERCSLTSDKGFGLGLSVVSRKGKCYKNPKKFK